MNPKPDASHTLAAAQIAGIYALVAAAWIVGSDSLVDALVPDHLQLTALQTAKGLAFVCVTAGVLFALIRRRLASESRLNRDVADADHALRAIMNQATVGIYILQDGRVAFANDYFARSLGYDGGRALTGADPASLVATSDRERVLANLRSRIGGAFAESRYTFAGLRRDGSEVAVGVHAMLVVFNGRPAVLGFAQDITEKQEHERQIRRYIGQLEKAMQGTLQVASRMVELRDPYTKGHERRVAELAAAIGAELGLSPDRIEGLRVAGGIHDVGKIAVPADILSKPSRLSRPEFDLVKQHSRQGSDILSTIEFPWPIAQIVLQHHERADGSGYPQGLRGGDILLEARILGVADTVEAMASHRPYRPALSVEEALLEIERNRGSLYDPAVADACLRLFREKAYRLAD